jgi:hypothetical protein
VAAGKYNRLKWQFEVAVAAGKYNRLKWQFEVAVSTAPLTATAS